MAFDKEALALKAHRSRVIRNTLGSRIPLLENVTLRK